MRVAPVQTLRRMRELDPQTRHAILLAARAGAIEAPGGFVPRDWGITGLTVGVYVRTHTVARGDAVTACMAATLAMPAYYRLIYVKGSTAGYPTDFTILYAGQINLSPDTSAYDREEDGYNWPPVSLPTYGLWAPGLYAVQLAPTSTFTAGTYDTAYFILRPRPNEITNANVLFCFPWTTGNAYTGPWGIAVSRLAA